MPKIEVEAQTKDRGRFVISPLESGYGVTLGNSLRRVMLASLEGAAITSLQIRDVYHEFSTLPHVREDMTSLLLNLKRERFKFLAEEADEARLCLEVQGEGAVTAADIVCPPSVEVVNPDTYLFTTDSPEADVEMAMTVSRGRGYSPAEERGKLPVAEIPADAVFSPVRRVSYKIERESIGQTSSFDRLVIDVWTDGTISPAEALSTGAQILVKHLLPLAEIGDVSVEVEPEVEESRIPEWIAQAEIEDLDLSVRAFNCLKRAGISQVGEIIERLERDEDELLSIRNFGQKSLDELKEKLAEKGFWPLPAE